MKKQLLLGAFIFGAFVTANAQDSCAGAIPLTVGSNSVGAINGEYLTSANGGCFNPPATGTDADAAEWYTFTSPTDAMVRVNTNLPANNPAQVDTRVAVYTGSCGALECFYAVDDISATNYLTDFTFPAEGGTTYYIAFDNKWTEVAFTVEISTQASACPATYNFTENWDIEANYYFCWEMFNVNDDAVAWQYNDVNDLNGDGTPDSVIAIPSPATGNAAKDEWLISNAINLVAGTEYTVSVKYNGFSPNPTTVANENLDIVMLNEQDPDAAGQIEVGSITGITYQGTIPTFEQNATTQTYTFTPNVSGDHYLGLHATSAAASGWLMVFEVTMSGPLGTNDALASSFSVYPNPATNVINIANADNTLVNGVQIVDINGRTVKTVKFDNVSEAQINISDLSAGMYLMNISSDKGTTTKKIVKN